MSPTVVTLILSLIGSCAPVARHNIAKEPKWRQIILMRSTHEDVEKLLGPAKSRGFLASHRVEDGTLRVEYYPFDFCTPAPDADLRVPQWTVVEMTYEPD